MDEQSYLRRVETCERSLYRIARTILWNDADCADAVQQAVFTGWIKRRQLKDEERFRPWLTRILVNECRNIQRRSLRQKHLVAAVENSLLTSPPLAPNESLKEAVQSLPEHYRLPILLHYMEGYPVREIAGIMGMTEKRVSDYLYRARRKLEKALKL